MTDSEVLLTSQKNTILTMIKHVGLDPSQFTWTEEDSLGIPGLRVSRLSHSEGFYFHFDFYAGGHHAYFSPAPGRRKDNAFPGDEIGVMRFVLDWLQRLQKEIQAPDLWAEIEKYRSAFSLTAPDHLPNDPIPPPEAENIRKELAELSGRLDSLFPMTEEQTQFVRSKLDYLTAATKRQGRRDWMHTAIGVFFTIAMALALAPDKLAEFGQLVRGLLGSVLLLLLGPGGG